VFSINSLIFFIFLRFYLRSNSTGRARMAGDDENRLKRRVSHRLGHRYFFSFFFVFSINSLIIFAFFYRFYLRSNSTGRARMAGDDENSPEGRKTRRLGHRFFSIFFSYFLYTNWWFSFFLGSIYVPKARGGLGWAGMTKTGPNDASRVVWAIGIF
jgi:hypothetical protein